MTGTVKTVLIVGGVAIGVVLLFKVLSPSPAAAAAGIKSGTSKPTDIVSLSGIFSLGAAALGALGGGGGTSHSTAAVYDTPGGLVATKDEWQNIADYNAQPGTQYGIAGLDY